MRWAVLVALALVAGCGDDDDDATLADAAVREDAALPGLDASAPADARPSADAMPSLPADAAAPDAAPLDADVTLQPDLTAEAITRDALSYFVQYCNRGDGVGADGPFRVRLSSATTSATFETGAFFAVPAAGTCATTGAITCGLVGDAKCQHSGGIVAQVDSSNDVDELNESNNTLVVAF